MFCQSCGKKLDDNVKFCDGCGTKIEQSGAVPPTQTTTTTATQQRVEQNTVPPQQQYRPQQQYQATPPPMAQPTYAPPYTGAATAGVPPLSIGQYLLIMLVMAIPILNIIMLFVWAFGGSVNRNKKNYAIAMLIVMLIGIVLSIVMGAALANIFNSIFSNFQQYSY